MPASDLISDVPILIGNAQEYKKRSAGSRSLFSEFHTSELGEKFFSVIKIRQKNTEHGAMP